MSSHSLALLHIALPSQCSTGCNPLVPISKGDLLFIAQDVVLVSPLPGSLPRLCFHPTQLLPPLAVGAGGRLVGLCELQPLPKPAFPTLSSCLTFLGGGALPGPGGLLQAKVSCLHDPFFPTGIDTSHHSPVFLEQLQGLLNLKRKEREKKKELCALHKSVVLTVLLNNGAVW